MNNSDEKPLKKIMFSQDNLYRKDTFTDLRVGSIRRNHGGHGKISRVHGEDVEADDLIDQRTEQSQLQINDDIKAAGSR